MIIPAIVWTICFGLFCTVIAIQVFYYLYFFRRMAYYQATEKETSVEHPVSVIICARDEAHNLVKNLPGVLVQDYATTHEVVLVNDNSTDESKYVIDEFRRSFKNLNMIELTQEAKMISGKKFPLSMGIKSAKYEIVLLTDADCVPASENWIKKMQGAYNDETEIVLGYGAYHKKPGLLNKLIRFETFHTALQYFSYALAGKPYMGVGRNLSYKKEVFFKNKGFSSINQIPSGDDDLFINQVATAENTAILLDHDTHTLSDAKNSWGEWMTQKYRHYSTGKYYKPIHQFLLGLYSFSLFLVYPLLVLSMLFFNWQLAVGVFALRFIVQAIVLYKGMNKLNERDLYPWFLFLDIWMFFYYLFTVPAIWKAPRKNWS
ncbi:MAG: glycosyl transferase family 2 [Sphingobacteriia bacterium 24-36-13]|uniref:glycosyltransferase n=2 Tax=Sediminibacterium sp. TaxID=1917865 RepID=UPI000BD8F788|nr:glycosyltransferase [Sediminibacterium sp.]OYY08233.1 MAG: glycosyl transferase family 2 [Sphingobacteriia bacterium 35-36-14]OYZ51768.1 MAG: glycosyl transferase family 2 [Sphingobacteriia bacterium 24-36-13]OZA63492.1 MAG: glycosyl transferase family 2 [Sphingobacteriia bacterium 39-36-14]HQS23868.1 glycosyltransferase [Sediminibacterium sp.]